MLEIVCLQEKTNSRSRRLSSGRRSTRNLPYLPSELKLACRNEPECSDNVSLNTRETADNKRNCTAPQMPECAKCDKPIRERHKRIPCSTCQQEYHTRCQGISDDKHQVLTENSDIFWFCKSCRVITSNMINKMVALEQRMSSIESSLKLQQEANRTLQDGMKKFKEQTEKTVGDLKKKVTVLKEEEIENLKGEMNFWKSKFYNHTEAKKTETTETKLKMDRLEQESKMNNLRIVGIPEEDGEKLQNKVLSITKQKLNLDAVEDSDIDLCYRLGRARDSMVRDVIVKFTSRDKRNLVYRCKRNMPRENPAIFINEDLTQPRNKLFYDARCLKK